MKRYVLVIALSVLALLSAACGGGTAEPEKPMLITTEDPLGEAWVIEGPTRDHPETGISVVRIRATMPDKNGIFVEGAALIGDGVGMKTGDRILTKMYKTFDSGKDRYFVTRFASKDLRFKSAKGTKPPEGAATFIPAPPEAAPPK